jgi:hypothetical protein
MNVLHHIDFGNIVLNLNNIDVLLALKDNRSYWKLGVYDEHVSAFLWNQVHFVANFELLQVELLLFAFGSFVF